MLNLPFCLEYLLPWVVFKHLYLLLSDGTVNVQHFSRLVDNFIMFPWRTTHSGYYADANDSWEYLFSNSLFLGGRNGGLLCLTYCCIGQLMHVLPMPGQQENGASRIPGYFPYLWEERLGILFKNRSGVRVPELLCLMMSAWCLLICEPKYWCS